MSECIAYASLSAGRAGTGKGGGNTPRGGEATGSGGHGRGGNGSGTPRPTSGRRGRAGTGQGAESGGGRRRTQTPRPRGAPPPVAPAAAGAALAGGGADADTGGNYGPVAKAAKAGRDLPQPFGGSRSGKGRGVKTAPWLTGGGGDRAVDSRPAASAEETGILQEVGFTPAAAAAARTAPKAALVSPAPADAVDAGQAVRTASAAAFEQAIQIVQDAEGPGDASGTGVLSSPPGASAGVTSDTVRALVGGAAAMATGPPDYSHLPAPPPAGRESEVSGEEASKRTVSELAHGAPPGGAGAAASSGSPSGVSQAPADASAVAGDGSCDAARANSVLRPDETAGMAGPMRGASPARASGGGAASVAGIMSTAATVFVSGADTHVPYASKPLAGSSDAAAYGHLPAPPPAPREAGTVQAGPMEVEARSAVLEQAPGASTGGAGAAASNGSPSGVSPALADASAASGDGPAGSSETAGVLVGVAGGTEGYGHLPTPPPAPLEAEVPATPMEVDEAMPRSRAEAQGALPLTRDQAMGGAGAAASSGSPSCALQSPAALSAAAAATRTAPAWSGSGAESPSLMGVGGPLRGSTHPLSATGAPAVSRTPSLGGGTGAAASTGGPGTVAVVEAGTAAERTFLPPAQEAVGRSAADHASPLPGQEAAASAGSRPADLWGSYDRQVLVDWTARRDAADRQEAVQELEKGGALLESWTDGLEVLDGRVHPPPLSRPFALGTWACGRCQNHWPPTAETCLSCRMDQKAVHVADWRLTNETIATGPRAGQQEVGLFEHVTKQFVWRHDWTEMDRLNACRASVGLEALPASDAIQLVEAALLRRAERRRSGSGKGKGKGGGSGAALPPPPPPPQRAVPGTGDVSAAAVAGGDARDDGSDGNAGTGPAGRVGGVTPAVGGQARGIHGITALRDLRLGMRATLWPTDVVTRTGLNASPGITSKALARARAKSGARPATRDSILLGTAGGLELLGR